MCVNPGTMVIGTTLKLAIITTSIDDLKIEDQLFEDLAKIATPGIEFTRDTLYHNDYSDETILKVTVNYLNQTYLKNLDQVNGGSHHITGS